VNLSLFEAPQSFDKRALSARLRTLADQKIFIGTSSWKYPGWLDQIYTRDRYLWHGKFSQKRFEAECLREFAETFPVVCGDFSFYQFPPPEFWKKLFDGAPPALKFALKVPEEITVEVFPLHPRYGARGGRPNESFLDTEILRAMFLEPLKPYRDRIACLIFEFGARHAPLADFVARLNPLLDALPDWFRYSVEVRNRDYLDDLYFSSLRSRRIAHVFNAWTKMPPLREHLAIPEAFTADFIVVRALLAFGRTYETAVQQFSPYDKIRDENREGRESLRALIERMREERRAMYLFVNNRYEGNSPETIRAITNEAAD